MLKNLCYRMILQSKQKLKFEEDKKLKVYITHN